MVSLLDHLISLKAQLVTIFNVRPGIVLFAFLFALSIASPQLLLAQSCEQQILTPKKSAPRLTEVTMITKIKAPINFIWETLVDYDKYPEVFNQLESVTITKRDGNLVYVESHFKSHRLIKREVQHTVNDLNGKPTVLKWELTDRDCKHVQGAWYLSPLSATVTQVEYHLAAEAGPVLPRPLLALILHIIQHEVVTSVVHYTEKGFLTQEEAEAN
jgi:ribosome-associated toxin RatA of RatAB toxin-antitoxin module